jgi:RND family efflux transporter MFP subunit
MMTMTPSPRILWTAIALATLSALGALALQASAAADGKPASAASAPAAKSALSVTVTQARSADLALRIAANGNIAAWQEASVGTETNGLRLDQVLVNVGDTVRRGQVLATFAPDTLQAEAAQLTATLAEAEASLAEARTNAQRARDLQASGALSAQQINQYLTAERTAQARLEAQQAMAKVQQLRLAQTRVLAPDNGIISARSATVGAVLPAGQELFRMIRQGRLEWRAEVPATELSSLKIGQTVEVTPPNLPPVKGRVRMVAPTVDPQTRNGLVYVDLPQPGAAKAGMFARGEFMLGSGSAMTLPQSAVLLRDGFTYVLRVGADSKVSETKVRVGRRSGDRIEILDGITPDARVVESGGGFLGDGDTVRVVAK